ncbi:MAG TPA: hypothetical protein VFP30_01900 [Candidatus Limnocylindria bacterium]|nr:hypothetical protein [Candidatus Limnocylindria bacterium]
MINQGRPIAPRIAITALILGLAVTGCTGAQSPHPSSPGADAPSEAPASSVAATETLGAGERDLEAGTYRVDLTAIAGGADYPPFDVTVPDRWSSIDGWVLSGPADDGGSSVSIAFWNVDQVYGHPCQWEGTLFDPGPGVDELAAALEQVPMRAPTEPMAVELGGRSGTYLEWSVPEDLAFDEDGNFPECDDDGEGHSDFRSWTGTGWASTRYQQGPGQVDRLWILDVDGQRLVIDGFSMPGATDEELAEMVAVVESIQFLDD